MSMPIEHERRQFLWYFLYLCWDRPWDPHQKTFIFVATDPGYAFTATGAGRCSSDWKWGMQKGTGLHIYTQALVSARFARSPRASSTSAILPFVTASERLSPSAS